MKKEFSTSWKASKQPRKQRKYLANAPLHLKAKLLTVNLSKELRKKILRRNIEVRKGDKVKVMRGKYKGKIGKVDNISVKYTAVYIEGIQIKKQEGSKKSIKFKPSNLQIIEMGGEDKKRTNKKIEIKQKTGEETKK